MSATVTNGVRSSNVVAARHLANPIGQVPGHPRNGGCRQPASQQPEKVPATALDGIMGEALPFMEFADSQMRMKVDTSWHAPVLQQSPATPYQIR
jgi:hypothetical protein